MEPVDLKPLKWQPEPGIAYSVKRRPDGGMHLTFTGADPATLAHWRRFGLEHLMDSDRLVRNLYDLRQLDDLPQQAIDFAVELNNDPSVRNIRLAAVATNEKVIAGLRKIAALTTGGGVEMGVFATIEEAEAWLDRPLTLLV